MTLQEKDSKYIWHPFTPLVGGPESLVVKSAEGVYFHLEDGRKIIDSVSSWWVNLHGHSNSKIAKAISEQAAQLEHVIFAGFTHEPAIQLAENLFSILPHQNKLFFSDNGSTAVEVALKMAIQYWVNKGIAGKRKIIALDGAYHGDTFGAMSVGERGEFTKPFSRFLFDVDFIPFPSLENRNESLKKFDQLVKQGDVAAFIYEPLVQGAGGMRMYSPEVLESLLQLAKTHEVICIADEVFTNFGRTGKLFASDYVFTKPDIMCLSKGITGGFLPLGVTTCNEKIVAAFQSDKIEHTFFHGHSYTANPVICAAALASFDILMSEECQSNIERIAHAHMKFKSKIESHPSVEDARSIGTILAIEIKVEDGSSYFNSLRKKIYPYFLERGILIRPLGNTIYILPPYVISDIELSFIYKAIEDFLDRG
jgi:adenosylmethionine-8-amino-7-oxononanoate aminotransferase